MAEANPIPTDPRFKDLTGQRCSRSGLSRTPEFKAWEQMIRRCHEPKHDRYKSYGGRGIKVCDRWLNSFSAFLEDMGLRPHDHSIERKDNNGNYEPGNCVWATARQQANNRRSNRVVSLRGESKTIAEWARTLGLPDNIIYTRLHRGWPLHRALTTPKRQYGH